MRANPNSYDTDAIAWANEQARLLRAGRFDALDIEHIADEIVDVGKSEKRELASRLAVLLAHMLKWQYQKFSRQGAKLAKEFQGVVEMIWRTHRAIRMLRRSLYFFLASWREQFPDLGLYVGPQTAQGAPHPSAAKPRKSIAALRFAAGLGCTAVRRPQSRGALRRMDQ